MKHPAHYDTTPEISKRMSRVKLKGNVPETMLAKCLWQRGYRYKRNDRSLPGSPDIAILKYKIAVFVDGEFWHGKDFYDGKVRANMSYWNEKIKENIERDSRNDALLRTIEWYPVHFWSRDVIKNTEACADEIEYLISNYNIDSRIDCLEDDAIGCDG